MTDKPKTMKKLFSAPVKNSVEKCTVPASSEKPTAVKKEIRKPNSIKLVEEKKSDQQNHTIKKGKPKQSVKGTPKSLTEEEYTEIFNSAINPTLNDEPPKSTERLQCDSSELSRPAPASPDLFISVVKDCEDEFCDIETDLPIDQWNDRSGEAVCQDTFSLSDKREGKVEHNSKPQKQKEEIIPLSLKKKKKSKMKDLHTTDMPNTIKTKAKHDLIKKNKEDSEEEEEEESGTWIQCSVTDCSKWRYVPDISDPMNVPDHWDCSMNSDKSRNTCDAPEVQYDDSEHIMTKYTLGSLVWVKLDGFPWWPAMIDTDPDYDTYFELPTATSMIPYLYHATFLDEHVSRAWVRSHLMMPYDHRSAPLKVTVKSRSCKKDLQAAVTIADKASKLSLQERLDMYSFSQRFSKSRPRVTSGTDKKRKTKKEKGSVAKEILSSPNAMMRELEMAIEKCKHSDDSEFSEGDYEYMPKKSRRQEQKRDHTPDLNNACKQKTKDSSKFSQELDSECGSGTEDNGEDKQQGGLKFDPDIFTMELISSENGPEDSQAKGIRKPHHGSDDGNCKNDGEPQGDVAAIDNEINTSTRKTKTPEECVEHKSKSKRKESNKSVKILQDIPISNSKRRKSDVKTKGNENKEKQVTGKTLSRKGDVNEQDDSGKENRDPNDSGQLDDKQKRQLPLEKKGSNEKKKKSESVKGEGNSKSLKRDSTGVLECKPKRKTSFVGVKKVGKKQTVCDINENNDKKQKLDQESSGISNMSGKTKINEGQRETEKVLDLEDKGRKQRGNKEVGKQSNDEKTVQHCQSKTTVISKEHNESVVNKKRKAGAKGFVIPVNSKVVCKASDRNVPCSPPRTHNDKNKPGKGKIEHDQFVPDLTNVVIEDISLPCREMENAVSNDHKSKIVEKISSKSNYGQEEEDDDDDHLNLSLDSLENECLDIDVTTEVSENGECDSVKIDKHEHGKFGGHCSDHGSDSDPFEMIED